MFSIVRSVTLVSLASAAALLGCQSSQEKEPYAPPTPPKAMRPLTDSTGFLSTYSRLEQAGPSSLRYLDPNNRLARYEKFAIAPVEVMLYTADATVSPENQRMLASEMRKALVNALSPRYQVVSDPAGDVAEVRVAITDIKRSTPVLNVIPRLKLVDFGLGGLAMEAEVIDSVSNVQIAALVESSVGRNLSWNTTQWDDAIGAMKDWAKRFRAAVDAAHDAGDQG
jgi:hypothetical protein